MAYIGQDPVIGRYILVDQISGGFNGTASGFTLAAGGQGVIPGLAQNVLLSLGGVIQQPGTDYTVSGSGITFTTPPLSGTTFFATVLGDVQAVGTPSDGTVLPASIATSGTFVFPNITTTGTTLIASGNASTPSLAVIGDINTGIYSPGADQLAISTNGTGRLFVDANGDVGLGVASPTAKLDLLGNGIASGIKITANLASQSAPGIQIIGKRADDNLNTNFSGRIFLSRNKTTGLVSAVTRLGAVNFGGNHTDSSEANILYSASVYGQSDGAFNSASDMPTALVFATGSTGITPDAVGTSGTERLRITSAGLVGIGTSSPEALLELAANNNTPGTDFLAAYNRLRFTDTDTTKVNSQTTGGIEWYTADSSDPGVYAYISSATTLAGAGWISFATGTNTTKTERVRIDQSGNVGIGTTGPLATLDITGSGEPLRFQSTTASTNYITHKHNSSGDIAYLGAGGGAALGSGATTDYAIRANQGALLFATNGNNERARIDSSGRLLVGTSSASGAALFQVQTPTTLSTTLDSGASLVNTSAKTYPTSTDFIVTAGLNENIEIGNSASITSGFNFVYGNRFLFTKSAGNTQDINNLRHSVLQNGLNWTDLNTCFNYTGITNSFGYAGIDANSRTSGLFNGQTNQIALNCPDGQTQTISNVLLYTDFLAITPVGSSTVNVTNSFGQSLSMFNSTAGTKTINIGTHTFLTTYFNGWGTSSFGTPGTMTVNITTMYGLRLRPPIGPGTGNTLNITNNWGIYQEWSNAKNWFAGGSNQFPNITTTASGANAFLDSADSNRLYRSTSSLTYKRDVEDLDSNLADQILNLRPVWYRSKCVADCEDWSWYGLIAEEVAEIDPRFVHYGYQEDAYEFVETTETVELSPDDPRREEGIDTEEITRQERQLKAGAQQVPNGVAYERLVVPLLDIIKRQKSQLDSFEARLAALEAQ